MPGLSRLLEWSLGVLAGLLLLGLIAVTCVDVVGRYVLDRPLQGAFELTQVLLAGLVFAALPLTTQGGEHVEVDLLAGAMPRTVFLMVGRVGAVIAAIALAVIAWRLWDQTLRLFTDGSVTSSLRIPLSLVAGFATVATALSAVIAAVQVVVGLPGDKDHATLAKRTDA